MRFSLPAIIGATLTLIPCSVSAAEQSREHWAPRTGDRVVVEVNTSTVYLIHTNGDFVTLNALTGQHRGVTYDGISYYAATPERDWEIRSMDIKGRSVTFGEGRFLRLSWPGTIDPRRGDESTAYGFHSHLSFERMIADKAEANAWDPNGTGWRSMGCILVSEEDLSLIEETWHLNGGVLSVATRNSVVLADFGVNTTTVASAPSWLGWLPGMAW